MRRLGVPFRQLATPVGMCRGSRLPINVGDIVLWLETDRITGLINNDPVAIWPDIGPYNLSPTASGAARPTYKTNSVNGKPALTFDGTNQYMLIPDNSPLDLMGDFTIFLVYTVSATNCHVFAHRVGAPDSGWVIYIQNGKAVYYDNGKGSGLTAPTVINDGNVFVSTVMRRNGVASIYRNGALEIQDNGFSNTIPNIAVGVGSSSAGLFRLWGKLAAIIVVNRWLSIGDRKRMETYLARWGMTVTHSTEYAPTNASTFLTTPTYEDSGQAIHPDVVYVPAGWNGHKFWMAMTPYPGGDVTKENPSILVSENGGTWSVPAGLTNPVVAYPGSGWNNDPDLILAQDNKLYLYSGQVNAAQTQMTIRVCSSSDGIAWSAPADLFTGLIEDCLSPAVVWNGAQYVMFTVNSTGSPNKVQYRTCATPNGIWSVAADCTLSLPSSCQPWHLDVIYADGVYHAFIAASDDGTYNTKYLYRATSSDGITWTVDPFPLLWRSPSGGWDDGKIYRATALVTDSGYHLWYSAVSGSTWHIGYTPVQRG